MKRVRRLPSLLMGLGSVISLAVALAACGGDTTQSDATPPPSDTADVGQSDTQPAEADLKQVQFMLPYKDSLGFIGYLVAKDRFFAEEGLEVESIPSDGAGFVVQQLLGGNVKFGGGGVADALLASTRGANLKAISALNFDIFTIVTPADSDIQTIEDLEGKAIGVTDLGGGEAPLVEAVLRDAGLEPREDVEILAIGAGGAATLDALETGQVSAYAGSTNDLLGLEQQGMEFREILPETFKGLPGVALMMSEDTFSNEEDLQDAIKIARAWHKGTVFALEHPEAAIEIGCQYAPEECEDEDLLPAYFDTSVNLYRKPDDLRWGEMDPAKWELIRDAIVGEQAQDVDVSNVIVNDFLDEINEFDEEDVAAAGTTSGS